jgi:hypothetical protein
MAVVISGKQPAVTSCDQTLVTLGITHSKGSGDPHLSPLLITEANGLGSSGEMKAQSEV